MNQNANRRSAGIIGATGYTGQELVRLLPREGRTFHAGAGAAVARAITAVQLAVPPAFMTFSPRIASGFRHLPGLIWHRPGASLRGVFSKAYVFRPMSKDTRFPLGRSGSATTVAPNRTSLP